MRRLLPLLFLLALVGCEHQDGDNPPRVEPNGAASRPVAKAPRPFSAADRAALVAAGEAYAKAEVDEPITVALDTVIGDVARFTVTPTDPHGTDPALAFLRRLPDGTWTGITLGTAFPPEDAQALGLPPEILP